MKRDAPYQETDRISPHFGHLIQPLDEGRWLCVACDGYDAFLDFQDWCGEIAKGRSDGRAHAGAVGCRPGYAPRQLGEKVWIRGCGSCSSR